MSVRVRSKRPRDRTVSPMTRADLTMIAPWSVMIYMVRRQGTLARPLRAVPFSLRERGAPFSLREKVARSAGRGFPIPP
jgi:hypothetical protein